MKQIHQALLSDLMNKANVSGRKRAHFNLHQDSGDPVQRFIVAIEPGSYIRPHRHSEPNKWEDVFIFKGTAVMLVFSEEGRIIEKAELKSGGMAVGAETPPGVWHTIAATSPGTVFLEFKPGPYQPLSEKDFARWSPGENDVCCPVFAEWFRTAEIGAVPPPKAGEGF